MVENIKCLHCYKQLFCWQKHLCSVPITTRDTDWKEFTSLLGLIFPHVYLPSFSTHLYRDDTDIDNTNEITRETSHQK